jgi:predicted DNA-binding transcriptional regulator AlpA
MTRIPDDDPLIPDPQVQKELGISAMTLWRWDRDPKLGFPPPIRIRRRKYRRRSALNRFKAAQEQSQSAYAAALIDLESEPA